MADEAREIPVRWVDEKRVRDEKGGFVTIHGHYEGPSGEVIADTDTGYEIHVSPRGGLAATKKNGDRRSLFNNDGGRMIVCDLEL